MLHYLALVRLFQRIVFALLTKEFFHVQTISFIVMVKVFFQFSSLNSVFISSSLNSVFILTNSGMLSEFCDSGLHI